MQHEKDHLQGLYIDLLKDLYSAENQMKKALPKMAKKAQSPELKRHFEEHLIQTEQQVQRIEQVFTELQGSPKGKKCVGMEGLIQEGEEAMSEGFEGEVLDAALIAAAQKVEHYEIAGYGTARTFANTLGYKNAARLLQQTLEEESQTNEKLTQLAESSINPRAAQ
ncbi:MAG: ferritin-like domain-containing protein [Chloroflexota bacterium]